MLHEDTPASSEQQPRRSAHPALDAAAETAAPFYVQSGSVFLNVIVAGDTANEPVLLLHGTALTNECFADTVTELTDSYFVITPDVRGHGDSEWTPDSRYTHEDCVSDVGAILDALGINTPVTLVGHSISGLHLARFAAANPERVRQVVLIDLLPETNDAVLLPIFSFIQREFASLEDAVEAVKGFASSKTEQEIAASLSKVMIYDQDREVFRYKSDPGFVQEFYGSNLLPFWDDLEAIQCPLTLIRGAYSRVIPAEAIEGFAARMPAAETVVIENANHNPMTDNPAVFTVVLKELLEAS